MDDELEIKAYYAGHVLGAAMVQIKVGSESVVYTVSESESRSEAGVFDGQDLRIASSSFFLRETIT